MNYTKPYGEGEFSEEFGESLPNARQGRRGLNILGGPQLITSKAAWIANLKYCILAKLCAEILDANCTGVYIPGKTYLIPNDASLHPELLRIATWRHCDVK